MPNGSLEWFICMSISFVVMVALIMIVKLSFIYGYALHAVTNYLRDHGAGHWYKQNKLAMRLGLKTMLTAVIAVSVELETTRFSWCRHKPFRDDVG